MTANILAPSLEIFGTYDKGQPNLERIVLRANRPVLLSNYAIILGYNSAPNNIIPFHDNLYWLGNLKLDLPCWVFLWTGQGTTSVSKETNTGDPIHNLYWNKTNTLFANDRVVPALFEFSSVQIGDQPNKDVNALVQQEVQANKFLEMLKLSGVKS